MSFSTELAGLVAGQLSRFITLNRHQLAGQAANLDFWLAEVQHALAVLDGYRVRFVRLEAAQESYVAAHGTTESVENAGEWIERKASRPRRIPDHVLRKARRALIEAASRFLERCHAERLLTEAQFSEASRALGRE